MAQRRGALERIARLVGDRRAASAFRGVPVIRGRARRCASQQGNALYAAVVLGLLDERGRRLARLLLRWQWPDGGWNCDRRPEAATSSFWESLIPLRGLAAYARATGDEAGFVGDRRCDDALDLLQSKRLPDWGWPAEGRFYQTARPAVSGCDLVSWGDVGRRRLNEWVTADALFVLQRAGRLGGSERTQHGVSTGATAT
jgi:hypothetical protein